MNKFPEHIVFDDGNQQIVGTVGDIEHETGFKVSPDAVWVHLSELRAISDILFRIPGRIEQLVADTDQYEDVRKGDAMDLAKSIREEIDGFKLRTYE